MTLEVAPLPDTEQLLWEFLRAQPEVTDLVAPERILSVIGSDFSFGAPFIRYRRIGGAPAIQRPLVADQPRIQIDCYAGTKSQTYRLASVVQAVIGARLVGAHPLGTVSRIEYGALSFAPDPDLATQGSGNRPRYIFDVRPIVKPPANPPA